MPCSSQEELHVIRLAAASRNCIRCALQQPRGTASELVQQSNAMHQYKAHLQVDKERLVLRYGHVPQYDPTLICQSVLPG